MWLIGGSKTKHKPVRDGRSAERRCEACDEITTHRECDVKDTFHLFFVDLVDTSTRRMVCGVCGEDHDVEEFFASLGASKTPASSRRVADAAPASSRRAPAELPPKPRSVRPDDPEIDDMLAALKKKIGRG